MRFDGGHKRDRFLTEILGAFVEWVPVCPEVEMGLGTPRPPMRLVREGALTRLQELRSGHDHTQAMQRYAARRVRDLRALDLCGYVLKRASPSCGLERVRRYGEEGRLRRDGRGLFTEALLRASPNLPVEEEGRLREARWRENFIERIFAYRRLRNLLAGRPGCSQLLAFHAAHELQLRAHAPASCRELGRRVAALSGRPGKAFREAYERDFMRALSRLATRGRNARVLRHAAGCLRPGLDPASGDELAQMIEDYREGAAPLLAPITLLRHHARRLGIADLQGQWFLEPHPHERMLRNRA